MVTKFNVTLSVDAKILEKFNQVKGDLKISHLVQNWLSEFIEKERGSTTTREHGGKSL